MGSGDGVVFRPRLWLHSKFPRQQALHQAALLLVEGAALGAEEGELLVGSVEEHTNSFLVLYRRKWQFDKTKISETDLLPVTDSNHSGRQPSHKICRFEVVLEEGKV